MCRGLMLPVPINRGILAEHGGGDAGAAGRAHSTDAEDGSDDGYDSREVGFAAGEDFADEVLSSNDRLSSTSHTKAR